MPSCRMSMMCTAPLPCAPGAPAAMSGIPSPSMSPSPETEVPNWSLAEIGGPPGVAPVISTVRFTVPPPFMNKTYTAPALPRRGVPDAMSGVPSPSRSPIPETDRPNASESASEGPLAVEPFISAVLFTVPSRFMNMTWSAPRPAPPASSPVAPAAMSGTPSPSRSPIPETEAPSMSWSASEGPLGVALLISAVRFTPPSRLSSMTWSAPRPCPPASSPVAPAAMSGTPSPSRSPMPETDRPNRSKFASNGPSGVPPFISMVRLAVPSEFISIIWTAPRPMPPASSSGAPAATSCIPSPSTSPMPATEVPNPSPAARTGSRFCVLPISTVPWAVPSALRRMLYTAPELGPAVSAAYAPAARSVVPPADRRTARANPNLSLSASEGPSGVISFISAVRFTVPSRFISITWTAPRPTPPASSSGAPAATSCIRSPSTSPMSSTERPKLSALESDGPLSVELSILAVLFTVPSRFMNIT